MGFPTKRMMIAGVAGAAAMMIGGALGAVSDQGYFPFTQPKPIVDANGEVMNPMIGGQAMLPGRNLLENVAASPEHTTLVAALRDSGIAAVLKSDGQFTLFAPPNMALSTLPASGKNRAQLARLMGYLVVPGRHDSRALLQAIGEGGGQAKLRTIEGGVLVARMNGPTNIILMDEKGVTADIAIYDVYDKNGVMHVIDHMLEPGMAARQLASR